MSQGLIQPAPLLALPPTGQTTSYRTGDDGELEFGNPRTTRFADTGAGTILDHATGLEWVQQAELIIPGAVGIHATNQIQVAQGVWSNLTDYVAADLVQGDGAPDALFYVCILANGPAGVGAQEPPNATYWRETIWTDSAADLASAVTMGWDDAIDNCLALDYAGKTDWRLPNLAELFSLIDHESSSSIYTTYFVLKSSNYWSSTTSKAVTTRAFNQRYGSSPTQARAEKVTTYLPVPVRGGILNG